ncbi:hypothetical protein [Escherichia coli]|uniref:hypothetical protein n=1 Tax=Escherichia coli TaxID=562 RepID=UPI00092F61EB|nr:hypothetical protein [Escherichia coli]MED0638754.1 hypothetical protein [Escherichia marmotae]EFA3992096.1 hypothetical protein [Escherichia coli]EFA3992983.1 hypothetical protein [Escherichia coli]EFB9195532.1 hypothetical protein [Escherichia coli]EFB9196793.1 hypothetical protein [Escherichia coli]
MTNKESTNTPSPARKRQRRKIAYEHESNRFAPCAFILEKFLKEYRRTKMGSHTWKTSRHGDVKEQE